MPDFTKFDNPLDYVIVGTKVFRIIRKPRLSGGFEDELVPWSMTMLAADVNKAEWSQIERYDSFCIIPENVNYQRRIINSYNLYEKLEYNPEPGDCPFILNFLSHIFREQIEYGLDYFQLLYLRPTQKLPILVLVSEERCTGKTTFLNFLKLIYGSNMAFNRSEDISNRFNTDYASKLIIGFDEAVADKLKDSEHLKAISTASTGVVEEKYAQKTTCEPFGKIVLCSNDINSPVIIDKFENRFWVREIPVLGKSDPDFLEKMKKEIPYFLHFLMNRKLSVPNAIGRMWFNTKDLETPALRRIKRNSIQNDEYDIAECLLDKMNNYNLDEISLTDTEIRNVLKNSNVCIPKNLHKIIAFKWKTPQAGSKMVYTSYDGDEPHHAEGRYYTFRKDDLLKKVEE